MPDIIININKKGETIKPFWKKLTTAGRAAEGLREDWRKQLREVQREIGFEYIRFHGIFHDDMMIYHEKEDGTPYYNWQYFDSLMDFLLEVNVRPILELGFTPAAMATGSQTCFWWKGNVTPPKDYKKWADLVTETVRHCINRYGMAEVLHWYFEVWNEPNLTYFWGGTQEEYFRLYECTAGAIKSIDPLLKVGGPSSCGFIDKKAPWLEEFLQFCSENSLPVDFITAHPYPNDSPLDEDGKHVMTLDEKDRTYRDIQWIRNAVKNSAYPDAEIHLTEWSSSPSPRDLIHDTAFMAPFIIRNNLKCIGLADSLGFWTFTDVFEETGAGDLPFHGGFGLINLQGLKKSSYYGYWFLSRLGNERVSEGENYYIARKDEKLQILLWNYCHYTDAIASGDRRALTDYDRDGAFDGNPAKVSLKIDRLQDTCRYKVTQHYLGKETGSVYDVWLRNGSPSSPSREEVEIFSKKSGVDSSIRIVGNCSVYEEEFLLQPHDVILIEVVKVV